MKVLFICGAYADENEKEVISLSKGYVEQSANIFQKKIIKGLERSHIDYKVISAPFIGAYPMRYKKCRFNGFRSLQSKYKYVSFNNIWGIRNFSRASAIKNEIRRNIKEYVDDELLVLVYCPHTPFLNAAVYAKSLVPNSKICFIVPDLPQYMNVNENNRFLYDIIKKYDIRIMEKFISAVDSFVLLTEPMKDVLNVGKRPYIVIEGLIDEEFVTPKNNVGDNIKRIVYTGKLNKKFGIKSLVDSFMKIKEDNYRLILCGDGDAREYILEKAQVDNRIQYKGVVTPREAVEYINSADALVNPRPNNEEYTKYSFPSKNIEYLMSGNPVVAYMLDGMPECYKDFLYVIPDNQNSFENILINACLKTEHKSDFITYAKKSLNATSLIEKIIKL